MRSRRLSSCLVLLALAAGCGHATPAAPAGHDDGGSAMRLDETGDGSTVTLRPGEALELVLPETRTTGYRWEVVHDGAPICRVVANAFQAGDRRPGAPGQHAWRIVGASPGTAAVSLALRRPFGGGEPSRSFTVNVVVR